MRIDPYSDQAALPIAPPTPGMGKGSGFAELLQDSIGEVNRLQLDSEQLIQAAASGEDIPPAVINSAVVKADLAFRTMIQIRNKLVEAFQELRRLQI